MTTVFIIGGFNLHHTIAESESIKLFDKGLKAKGYNVVLVDIAWRYKILSKFCEEFKSVYTAHRTEHNVIIGNSFGAIVALLAAPDLKPDKLYLCSLSAFFQEDLGQQPNEYGLNRFGKRRMNDLWSLSFDEIVERYAKLSTEIIVAYGEKEKNMYPSLVRRCERAAATLPNAYLIELPGSGHSMSDHIYAKEILKHIPNLYSTGQKT